MGLIFYGAAGFALVLGLYLFIIINFVDYEYDSLSEHLFHQEMDILQDYSPQTSFGPRGYNFGRFRRPIGDMNLHSLTKPQELFQKKEFVWTAIGNREWFIGSAILQFNYNSALIVYAYDIVNSISHFKQVEIPLFTFIGAHFAKDSQNKSSAIAGCAYWSSLGTTASKCGVMRNGLPIHIISLKGTFHDGLSYDIYYELEMSDEVMGMVYPIGPNRASVVTKAGGVRVTNARIQFGQLPPIPFNYGLGLMDYTRGLLRRTTLWHWLACTWYSKDHMHRYGLQLSEGTYDNPQNISLENSLWADGITYPIREAISFIPLNTNVAPQHTTWEVSSPSIQLTFIPNNLILGTFHYYIVDGDLYHIWGLYSGYITQVINGTKYRVLLNNIPGTLEDHYAVW